MDGGMTTIISGTTGVDKIQPGVVGATNLAPACVGNVAIVDGAVDIPKSSGFPFTKEYVSTEQTITSGGTINLTHGLGAVPKLVRAELVCVVANGTHGLGDIIELDGGYIPPSTLASIGHEIKKNETTITVIYGSAATVYLAKSTAGASEPLTNTSWRLIVRAWA